MQQVLITQISLVIKLGEMRKCLSVKFHGLSSWLSSNRAYDSNFMGYQAGSNAMGAFDSNFFGNQAGSNATDAGHNQTSW
jgi:hypothetical protein